MKKPFQRKLRLADLREEPFRLFFPAAVLAGLLGVAVWPLYFGGVLEMYPGTGHTRLMGQGFFGAFIFGFLGTALPRMLSTKPFHLWQTTSCLALFAVFAAANFLGATRIGDGAFLLLLVVFLGSAGVKWKQRRDVPPPGFALVGLAFLCALIGTWIGFLSHGAELDATWLVLRPLLAYQGFVLLPVLGVGAFILPKFLGLPNTHDLPESATPPAGWWGKALFALAAGVIIVGSFFVEAAGWHRAAHAVRFAAAAVYIWRTVPVHRATWRGPVMGWSLRLGLAMILAGLAAVVIWPEFRVGLLHILLVGGLGVVTIVVATRVVFGHSGQAQRLGAKNRWMWWVLGLIVLGMATRISGDFLPHIMVSHYNYGALGWAMGMGLWAWKVLPNVLVPDEE
jgi:uncharacterized protein involved in response to NO